MRWSTLVLGGVLLMAGFVPGAQAQEEKEKEAEKGKEKCVCIEPWSTVRVSPRYSDLQSLMWTTESRPRLGVWIHSEANPETDRYGALIDGVMKGSPADKAGVKEGDVITELDGVSLLSGQEEYDEELSAPGQRLVARTKELERGDTIVVKLRRDGATETFDLVVGEFDEPFSFATVMRTGPQAERIDRWVERLQGLELVSLNPGLGEYFGAEEGVLVVSVPEDSELNLMDGDVITAIDGRKVKSPSHAMRILRSYEADEEVSFDILRKQRSMSVTGKASGPFTGRNVIKIERKK
jgi:S1-C subfamily serine protease